MHLTFLQAKVGSLSKAVSPAGITPYPLAKQFRAHVQSVDNLTDFHTALCNHAAAGHCLHVGDLLTDLSSWGSRAGKANRESELHWMVLDVDGLVISGLPVTFNADSFAEIAIRVVDMLGLNDLADTSFIAQASTKMGLLRDKVSMHIFFLLDGPVRSHQLKSWMKNANLNSDLLRGNIRLSSNGHSLCWPLDISCADTGRLIYIAPPVFTDRANPFPNLTDRVVLVRRGLSAVYSNAITDSQPQPRVENALKTQLRELAGYNPRENARLRTIMHNGERVELLMNPAQGVLRPHSRTRGFCYYNLNDGDSGAYFHAEGRPDIIYNFKGEPAFRWADVDPEGYGKYCDENAEVIAKADPINTFMVINKSDDRIYKIWHNHELKTVTCILSSRDQMEDFYTEYGRIPPDFLPTWTIEYNPSAEFQIDYTGKTINLFVPSPLMQKGQIEVYDTPLNTETATRVSDICPTIWFLLDHMCGHGQQELKHFLNWLATIFQKRQKTESAWIFQGNEGTGKGTLFREILTPLFGDQNITMRGNDDLTDTFNAWRKGKLIVCIDEFEAPNNRTGQQTLARLRNWITESRASVRAMHKMGEDVPLFENYMFFTNKHNMLPISETDRRYSVCPRQEVKLEAICDTVQMYAGIRNEVERFANIMHAWEADTDLARRCLNNDAKRVARIASRSMAEEFSAALTTGDLDFMLQVFESLGHPRDDYILAFDSARRIVIDMVRHRDEETYYSAADIGLLYNTLFDQRLSTIAISKMLARHGLVSGRFRQGGAISRGYKLLMNKTTLDQEQIDALVAANTSTPLRAVNE